jgi:hypothetical protein
MKVLSHSGFDVMTLEVEEMPWWHRIFNKPPVIQKYTGHKDKWRDANNVLVDRKKSLELQEQWDILRLKATTARNRARGRV